MGQRKLITFKSDAKQTMESGITNVNFKRTNNTNSKLVRTSYIKKHLASIIKYEFDFISSLFEVLDISKLNHGRREEEGDDDSESLQVENIPEQKNFKKHAQKKGSSQVSAKNKSFPHTIEGLEKELEELKGTPMTYQKTLRKKGLHSRLVKKKRKEEARQRKTALKLEKKQSGVNGPGKLIKPVLNSEGNVVTNKYDFADSDIKKENKRKLGVAGSKLNLNHEGRLFKSDNNTKNNPVNLTANGNSASTPLVSSSGKQSDQVKKGFSDYFKTSETLIKNKTIPPKIGQHVNNELVAPKVKVETKKGENSTKTPNEENKSSLKPVFNKENKIVFSRVFIPENHKKLRKKVEKDPKKILQKIKEQSNKINELEKEDHEKATLIKEKQKWTAALKRASGEKVKDDPELLKKSIMRGKNKKMRSKKKWQARIENLEKGKEERQKKRTENIQARKTEKNKRKMKKAIKKGSFVQV